MAANIFAGIAGDILGSTVSGLVNAGANAINQGVEFGFNQALQENSFKHDRDMLERQVAATRQLQSDLIAVREQALRRGGFSDADAARGAVGGPMTKLVDWNGTRLAAPGAMHTTAYSGRFISAPQRTPHTHGTPKTQQTSVGTPLQSDTSSVVSQPTASTSLSRTRTQSWVSEQQRLQPFHPNALQLTWGSVPSSSSSSVRTASTVSGTVLDSWTPAFNLKHQPLFARFHPRGASNV